MWHCSVSLSHVQSKSRSAVTYEKWQIPVLCVIWGWICHVKSAFLNELLEEDYSPTVSEIMTLCWDLSQSKVKKKTAKTIWPSQHLYVQLLQIWLSSVFPIHLKRWSALWIVEPISRGFNPAFLFHTKSELIHRVCEYIVDIQRNVKVGLYSPCHHLFCNKMNCHLKYDTVCRFS